IEPLLACLDIKSHECRSAGRRRLACRRRHRAYPYPPRPIVREDTQDRQEAILRAGLDPRCRERLTRARSIHDAFPAPNVKGSTAPRTEAFGKHPRIVEGDIARGCGG